MAYGGKGNFELRDLLGMSNQSDYHREMLRRYEFERLKMMNSGLGGILTPMQEVKEQTAGNLLLLLENE